MMKKYDIVLNDQYRLGGILASDILVTEALDDIALRISFSLMVTPDLPKISVGDDVKISGIPYGSTAYKTMYQGVIWTVDSNTTGNKTLEVTVYERTMYLKVSEDSFQLKAGTASQRINIYASGWGIPIGDIPNTGVVLGKVDRTTTIQGCINSDLKETVQKGGEPYRARIKSTRLELYKLGTNSDVYELKGTNFEVGQARTLEGVVTQVKVLDNSKTVTVPYVDSKGRKRTKQQKVNGGGGRVFSGPVDKLGTIQKVLTVSESSSLDESYKQAQNMIWPSEKETFTVSGLGVNTIRAGDRVRIETLPYDVFVTNITHRLGNNDKMTLTAATMGYIRREFYY